MEPQTLNFTKFGNMSNGPNCSVGAIPGATLTVFMPNRLGRFDLMTWRVRPSGRTNSSPVSIQACRTESRDKLLTDECDTRTAGIQRQCVRSAIFFIGEFFSDDLASYRNCLISRFIYGLFRVAKVLSVVSKDTDFNADFTSLSAFPKKCLGFLAEKL